MAPLAPPAPAGRPAAEEVLLGLGNTVDEEIVWDDRTVSGLLRHHGVRVGDGPVAGPLGTEADLLRALLAHLRDGDGGEHFVASKELLAGFAGHFRSEITLGGTNVRAALAMRVLGRPSTVHLVSTNEHTRRLLPPDIAVVSSAEQDSLDLHVIVQFPVQAVVQAVDGTLTTSRANRVILTNDVPNRELVIAEEFGDAVARAHVVLVSGFNSTQEPPVLEQRMADVLRHLRRRSPDAVVVYEHGAFHVPAFSDRVREVVGPHVDVWCCNEEELQAHLGHTVDLLDPPQVLAAARKLHADVGAPTLIVHTRHWALALGGQVARREAMLRGGTELAAARYGCGDALTAQDVAEARRWPRQADGEEFATCLQRLGGDEVSCVAALEVPTSRPTTIGLGDTFVGGVVAAVASLSR